MSLIPGPAARRRPLGIEMLIERLCDGGDGLLGMTASAPLAAMASISGCTELQCIGCDDYPAVKWAQSPLTVPDKPVAAERV